MDGTIPKLTEQIKRNPLPWAIQIIGFLVVLVNLWAAAKLAPLATNIAVVVNQVDALGDWKKVVDPIIMDSMVTKSQVENLGNDVREIKEDVKDMKENGVTLKQIQGYFEGQQ